MENTVGVKPCPVCDAASATHERVIRGCELARCTACGFVFANVPDEAVKAANATYDDGSIERYAAMQSVMDMFWFRRIARRLTRRLGTGRVLDVGCGNGVLLKCFIDLGWQAEGVDLSPWARRFAAEYGFTLHEGELEKMGLPDGRFDAVTSTSALEHIPAPAGHVREILRVLRPGGVAHFAGIPNYGSWAVRLGLSRFYHNVPPWHANFFTPATVRRLFARPDVAPLVGTLRVISYGVPGFYQTYQRVKRAARRVLRPVRGREKQHNEDLRAEARPSAPVSAP